MESEARNEVARLWRVYQTIHQLVNDRVRRARQLFICLGGELNRFLLNRITRATWFLNQNCKWI